MISKKTVWKDCYTYSYATKPSLRKDDKIMEELKDQLYDLDENLDNYLIYDREAYLKESLYSTGFVDGYKRGLEEGRLIVRQSIITPMLEKMTIEEASEFTGLPIEEIEKIVVSSKNEEENS